MVHVSKSFRRFRNDQTGATAVEYAMILGLIAVASMATLSTLGGNVNSMFSTISNSIAPASAPKVP